MSSTKMHVSLNVRSVEESIRFYEAFFGVVAHKRRADYANFDLITPSLKLALQEMPDLEARPLTADGAPPVRNTGALSHLGILLDTKAEVDAVRERLIASGLATFDEGDTVCCYARQDKIWVHDPDGNGWEVYTLLDDQAEEAITALLNNAVTCCGDDQAGSALLSLISAGAGESVSS